MTTRVMEEMQSYGSSAAVLSHVVVQIQIQIQIQIQVEIQIQYNSKRGCVLSGGKNSYVGGVESLCESVLGWNPTAHRCAKQQTHNAIQQRKKH